MGGRVRVRTIGKVVWCGVGWWSKPDLSQQVQQQQPQQQQQQQQHVNHAHTHTHRHTDTQTHRHTDTYTHTQKLIRGMVQTRTLVQQAIHKNSNNDEYNNKTQQRHGSFHDCGRDLGVGEGPRAGGGSPNDWLFSKTPGKVDFSDLGPSGACPMWCLAPVVPGRCCAWPQWCLAANNRNSAR